MLCVPLEVIFCPLREENWVGDAYWRCGCQWQYIKIRKQKFAGLIDCSLKRPSLLHEMLSVSIWTPSAVLQNWSHIPHLLPLLYKIQPCGIWNPLSFQPCSRSCHQPQAHFRKTLSLPIHRKKQVCFHGNFLLWGHSTARAFSDPISNSEPVAIPDHTHLWDWAIQCYVWGLHYEIFNSSPE